MRATKQHHRLTVLGGLTGAGVLALMTIAGPASADTEVDEPDEFTSAFTVMATADQVIDSEGEVAPGEEGATGEFNFRINSEQEIICYDITLRGVTGEYESPARTATHIHEADAGEPGPPRLAFPNPEGDGDTRTASGCMEGPFTTGLEDDDGNDTAEGFSLAQIEANPEGFTADTHTAEFLPGTVRGQLSQVPVGGVESGGGGTGVESGATGTGTDAGSAMPWIALGAAAAGVGGFALLRRERSSRSA